LARRIDRNQRGSNLVEAALILPVIVFLTFGAIDFGIGFNQKAGLDNAGRAGARLGATDTIVDNATDTTTAAGVIPANTKIGFDSGGAVNANLAQAEKTPELVNMYVFRSAYNSATNSWSPSSVSSGGACTSDCIQYSPRTSNGGQFNLYKSGDGLSPNGTWPATAPLYADRMACGPSGAAVNADRIGITIVAKYHFLSGMIGNTITLTSTSTAQLEPTNC
jgi:Flp pilus assembly protein TadG